MIRADRADGVYLKNFYVEYSDFNDIYLLETNGFRFDRIVSRYSREYAILSFTSDHGIYENCETSHNGDSGVYPGSGPNGRHGQPDAHGHGYGIIIRNCDSHDNTIGYSGTAGNGTWCAPQQVPRQLRRHHDRLVRARPPRHAAGQLEVEREPRSTPTTTTSSHDERDAYCAEHAVGSSATRDLVCPTFQVPVGTGLLIAGGNDNIVEDNYFFDNWRNGTMLLWVPATLRGEQDPAQDLRHLRQQPLRGQLHGRAPGGARPGQVDFTPCQGTRDPNGTDFWWDEEEGQDCDPRTSRAASTRDTCIGNCWVQTKLGRPSGAAEQRPGAAAAAGLPGHRPVPARQLGQAGAPGPVRDLEPDDEPESARLRLVHAPTGAELALTDRATAR